MGERAGRPLCLHGGTIGTGSYEGGSLFGLRIASPAINQAFAEREPSRYLLDHKSCCSEGSSKPTSGKAPRGRYGRFVVSYENYAGIEPGWSKTSSDENNR